MYFSELSSALSALFTCAENKSEPANTTLSELFSAHERVPNIWQMHIPAGVDIQATTPILADHLNHHEPADLLYIDDSYIAGTKFMPIKTAKTDSYQIPRGSWLTISPDLNKYDQHALVYRAGLFPEMLHSASTELNTAPASPHTISENNSASSIPTSFSDDKSAVDHTDVSELISAKNGIRSVSDLDSVPSLSHFTDLKPDPDHSVFTENKPAENAEYTLADLASDTKKWQALFPDLSSERMIAPGILTDIKTEKEMNLRLAADFLSEKERMIALRSDLLSESMMETSFFPDLASEKLQHWHMTDLISAKKACKLAAGNNSETWRACGHVEADLTEKLENRMKQYNPWDESSITCGSWLSELTHSQNGFVAYVTSSKKVYNHYNYDVKLFMSADLLDNEEKEMFKPRIIHVNSMKHNRQDFDNALAKIKRAH